MEAVFVFRDRTLENKTRIHAKHLLHSKHYCGVVSFICRVAANKLDDLLFILFMVEL